MNRPQCVQLELLLDEYLGLEDSHTGLDALSAVVEREDDRRTLAREREVPDGGVANWEKELELGQRITSTTRDEKRRTMNEQLTAQSARPPARRRRDALDTRRMTNAVLERRASTASVSVAQTKEQRQKTHNI
jgi:hypothetical protein